MLQIKKVKKKFTTGSLTQVALNNVSLNFRDNEFVAILGPSGSGKTTLLNITGGLDRYDSGDLIINGISTKKYKDRDWDSYRNHTIGFVFQSYNLISHQTILANVELALTISGISRKERKKKALAALRKVGLEEQAHKKPSQMSGGQMQRVAIARALVNNPDILLADEPTGALDTKTSIQVMDILKEIAKDKLVIMVTHNPELAEQYATRIVKLKDGSIIDDTNPFNVKSVKKPKHKNMGHSSMSFFTALTLSFNNLKTKRARTLLTSFAGSIGIIGIALILALSNGVNGYIKTLEEETLSEYPIKISKSEMDITSLMAENSGLIKSSGQKTKEITENKTLSTLLTKKTSNDLKSLKAYVSENEDIFNNCCSSVEYTYDVTPNLFRLKNENEYRQINPDKTLTSLTGSLSNMLSAVFSMGSSQFRAMPENENLYLEQYEVLAGKWPSNYHECVVVVSPDNSVSDLFLYSVGIKDIGELKDIVAAYTNNNKNKIELKSSKYKYTDFLNLEFKLVDPSSFYEYDKENNIYIDKTDNKEYMLEKVKNGETIKTVGVVRAKETAAAAMLLPGIAYPHSLDLHVIETAQKSQLVKKQKENKNINIFTGKQFGKDRQNFDLSSLFDMEKENIDFSSMIKEIDTKDLVKNEDLSLFDDINIESLLGDMDTSSFLQNIDFSSIQIDSGGINENLSSFLDIDFDSIVKEVNFEEIIKDIEFEDMISDEDLESLFADIDYEKLIEGIDFTSIVESIDLSDIEMSVSKEDMSELFTSLMNAYVSQLEEGEEMTPDSFFNYATSEDGISLIKNKINDVFDFSAIKQTIGEKIKQAIKNNISESAKQEINKYTNEIGKKLIENISKKTSSQFSTVIQKYVTNITDSAGKEIESKISEKISSGMQTYMSQIMTSVGQQISSQITNAIEGTFSSMAEKIGSKISETISSKMSSLFETILSSASKKISEELLKKFNIDISNDEIKEILSSLTNGSSNTYDKVMASLNYAEIEDPYSILFYPKDFESKDKLTKILEDYNNNMKKTGNDKKVITYTDMVGTLMSSVTTIVNVISYVLIAFVSVSLVVSSIMIGIITYVSVLERTKEIGILRAIGASKRNISQVFNAETFIIGLCAGTFGIVFTLLALIPTNTIVRNITGIQTLTAYLPIKSVFLLIALSVFLTLLSGFIPAKKAAKKDPVISLRIE